MRRARKRGPVVTALAVAASLTAAALSADEPVDFQHGIRPILAQHCFKCHGPDEGARQAELRLDLRESAVMASPSGRQPIVPGEPGESELLRRVTSTDPGVVMPPPEEKKPLNAEQRELLRRWISDGAPYSGHWAFTAPKRSELPVADVRHPVDAFVLERLHRAGLSMSPPASHAVLSRRLALDLVGLPPTPAEVDAFVEAAGRDVSSAVEAFVDRLLDREHFGEKWARHWLDVARYADSNGYEKDVRREQWAWRDWVIGALNQDMPYTQFVVEQIAGDLLPGRTQDQLVATGFLRNGMINEEGAIVYEQFRMEGMFDRMDCIGKAVLGLSIQCAQCHSHKFDPISQGEYYGMFAILNDASDARSYVYTAEQQRELAEIRAGIRKLEGQLKDENPDWQKRLLAWEENEGRRTPKWEILDTTEQVWVSGVSHPREIHDHSVVLLGHPTTKGEMYFVAEPRLDGVTGMRLEALTYRDLPFGGPGRNTRGVFALSELRVEAMPPGSEQWVTLKLTNATADFSEEEQLLDGEQKPKRRVGPVAFLVDGKQETGWRADRGPGRRNTDSVAVVEFAEPVTFPGGTRLKVSLIFQHSKDPRDIRESTQIGRSRLAITRSAEPRATTYDHAAALAMQKPSRARSAAERAAVFAAWRKRVASLKTINDAIAALEEKYPEAPTSVLTVLEREPGHSRETFLLDRGIWNKPTRKIAPHVPAVLHPMKPSDEPQRLAFARWLADDRSPLTARVQVNRVWQAIFGAGLVETPEDFGTRAPQPAYLNLLDWLAVDFMERGWSAKQLIRTIVTSTTYRQSSRVTPELLEIDPGNRLLARGPRFRAEAEVVRDIALSVSGLLNPRVGGPSFFPPVPANVLKDNFAGTGYWIPPQGAERYRRAIYMFRKRAMPDPVLTAFDAPNADFACARRVRSNTPLAALASLNDPIFTEAARAMALRILREGGVNDEERADYAFRLVTGRRSNATERAEVLALLEDRRRRLAEGWLSINEVATGDAAKKPAIPPDTTPQDAAAWTIAARVLLNLDETLSKN